MFHVRGSSDMNAKAMQVSHVTGESLVDLRWSFPDLLLQRSLQNGPALALRGVRLLEESVIKVCQEPTLSVQ